MQSSSGVSSNGSLHLSIGSEFEPVSEVCSSVAGLREQDENSCPQGGGGPTGSGSSVVTIGGLSVPPAPHLVPAGSSTSSSPPPAASSSQLTNSGSPSTSTPPPPPPSSPHASRTPPVPPRGHHHISTTYITQVPSIVLFTEFYKLSSRTRALLQSPPQVPEERTRPAAR